jgi:tRNA pseudouridine55 synthase
MNDREGRAMNGSGSRSSRGLDGVLVVDKPSGPTSHDMVDRVRRAVRIRRVGHTGTLDPFATGVLPICLGRATRLTRFLGMGEKVYRATVRLGFATSTDDRTGEPLSPPVAVGVDPAALEAALGALVGSFDQVPPAFSARRVGGRRLYELARRGEAAPREATRVTVYELTLHGRDGELLDLEVRCSPGTYVRALARDLGERLGVGGHLAALRRTRSGSFGLDEAVSGDDLAGARERVLPLGALLPELPAVRVGREGRERLRHGRDLDRGLTLSGFPVGPVERVRVLDETGDLLALAVPRGFAAGGGAPLVEAALHPDVVLLT